MKAIIDGKLYDTETATELARWRQPSRTMRLYRTPKGAHFLTKKLDKTSPYIRRNRLLPIEDKHLVAVVEQYGGVEEVLRLFPHRIEIA